ncbi:MAG: sigma-54-dependent transcriptional regulator [Candidatus Deferrimicrobiaceae bacterium]
MYSPSTPGSEPLPPSILIVDDDEAICEVLATYLRPLGYHLRVAHTGNSALAALREESPDVALLDLRLTDMSGQEIHRQIRERHLDTEVIIVTGFASLDSALGAIKSGAFDYIVKPFKLGEIGISVRNALDRIGLKKKNRELTEKVRELTRRLGRTGSLGGTPTIRFESVPFKRSSPERTAPLVAYGGPNERKS